jgi:hypothetical protein
MAHELQPKPVRPGTQVAEVQVTEPVAPTPPERRYRVEELTTQGWELSDTDTKDLSRADASRILQDLLNDGLPPDRIRAVIDDGTKI